MAVIDLLGDDGCYDAAGNDLGVAQVNCYSAGGMWLAGQGVYVSNGNVYVQVQYTQLNNDGSSTYVDGPQLAGSFASLFGWQFQNTNLTVVSASAPNGAGTNCPAGQTCTGAASNGPPAMPKTLVAYFKWGWNQPVPTTFGQSFHQQICAQIAASNVDMPYEKLIALGGTLFAGASTGGPGAAVVGGGSALVLGLQDQFTKEANSLTGCFQSP